MALKENYKDDILDVSVNTKRKYRMTDNGDGTVSLDDETVYTQEGDSFGASDLNDMAHAINNIATDAEHTSYDNTTSGLQATNVQDAVDEINDNLSGLSTTINSMKLRFVEYDITITREGGWGYWGQVTINHGLGRQAQIFPIRCRLSTDMNVLGIIAVQDITSTTLTVTINAIKSGTYKCSFLYDYN